jgi:hypothetical protein
MAKELETVTIREIYVAILFVCLKSGNRSTAHFRTAIIGGFCLYAESLRGIYNDF